MLVAGAGAGAGAVVLVLVPVLVSVLVLALALFLFLFPFLILVLVLVIVLILAPAPSSNPIATPLPLYPPWPCRRTRHGIWRSFCFPSQHRRAKGLVRLLCFVRTASTLESVGRGRTHLVTRT